MVLSPAERLGPYEILSLLGAGGMGQVYRARDTRLDRTVAIKVLTVSGSESDAAARLERFRREARAISRLSHPHICSLLDVGDENGHAFLVMEDLEGETLAARLAEGRLPLERALRHATQIAAALDAAHRQGIVHRDLKPANVMLTRDGVKLLDFGLAKLRPGADDALAASDTGELTSEGTILGTVPYMAPEQLEGLETDARTDIFALGVVLYEMVGGRRPFVGDSKPRIMAAILQSEPAPVSTVQPTSPPVLDHLLARCLAKDPDERWQTARDVGIALSWVLEGGSAAGLPGAAVVRRERRARLGAALVGGLCVAAVGLAAWTLNRPPPTPPRPRLRLELSLEPSALIDAGMRALSLSPDASRLAYVSGSREDRHLFLRLLSQPQSGVVPGTEGAASPFFSPDGRWVGFFADGALKKVAVSGGAPVRLCAAAEEGTSGAWGPDDTIAFSGGPGHGLLAVPAGGGATRTLTTLDGAQGESTHSYPHFLPGGDSLLFTVTTVRGAPRMTVVQDLASGDRRKLFAGYDARYLGSGHVVFNRGNSLFGARFDPRRRAVLGTPVAVQEDVKANPAHAIARSDVSASGSLVYAPTIAHTPRQLLWVDRQGSARPLPVPPRPFQTPRLSHDGRQVAVAVEGEVWLLDLERASLSRLTFGPGKSGTPVWTPDDRRVTYPCRRSGADDGVCWRATDGSGVEEQLFTRAGQTDLGAWAPDGSALLFVDHSLETGHDIWTFPLAGDRKPRPLLASRFDERSPALSPDGRWLAYASDESGRLEVYVQPFPAVGAKWAVSSGGGEQPTWSRDGRELFYRQRHEMMAVSVQVRPQLKVGVPRALFARRYLTFPNMPWTDYDVAGDGQRFLMVKMDFASDAALVMVVDWAEELKVRLPGPQ